jgi:hypothetical protein
LASPLVAAVDFAVFAVAVLPVSLPMFKWEEWSSTIKKEKREREMP